MSRLRTPLSEAESKLIDAVNELDDLASEADADNFTAKAKEVRLVLAHVEESLRQVQRLRDGDSREGA